MSDQNIVVREQASKLKYLLFTLCGLAFLGTVAALSIQTTRVHDLYGRMHAMAEGRYTQSRNMAYVAGDDRISPYHITALHANCFLEASMRVEKEMMQGRSAWADLVRLIMPGLFKDETRSNTNRLARLVTACNEFPLLRYHSSYNTVSQEQLDTAGLSFEQYDALWRQSYVDMQRDPVLKSLGFNLTDTPQDYWAAVEKHYGCKYGEEAVGGKHC